jgi:hypothetical protein
VCHTIKANQQKSIPCYPPTTRGISQSEKTLSEVI